MKHILLIAALLTLFALSPLGADAQGVIGRERKEKPKPKSTTKTNKAKQGSSNTRSHSSSVPNLREELNKLANNMVYVQGGTFMMGARADDSDALNDEKPANQVTLSSYYICKYEVTQSLWQEVMGSNPSRFNGDNLPVENVSWNDCQQFINKLNALTGLHYRLPTEAEWEFAARGGNDSRSYKYSGSNTLSDVAWYSDNSGFTTHPVGSNSPNELGLYDMSGNVWEWCSDWYGSYNSSAQTNPAGPWSGTCRVLRGGSCSSVARCCRASYRFNNAPDHRNYYLGLRLVRSIVNNVLQKRKVTIPPVPKSPKVRRPNANGLPALGITGVGRGGYAWVS